VYPDKIRRLVNAFLTCAGKTTPALRRAIEADGARLAGWERKDEGAVPEALSTYAEKVALHAYKIVDEDVEEMKRAGYSEDEIFEITLGAALGASLARLERGLTLLDGSE
jgi:alkylhydroperoxidase family enzyme